MRLSRGRSVETQGRSTRRRRSAACGGAGAQRGTALERSLRPRWGAAWDRVGGSVELRWGAVVVEGAQRVAEQGVQNRAVLGPSMRLRLSAACGCAGAQRGAAQGRSEELRMAAAGGCAWTQQGAAQGSSTGLRGRTACSCAEVWRGTAQQCSVQLRRGRSLGCAGARHAAALGCSGGPHWGAARGCAGAQRGTAHECSMRGGSWGKHGVCPLDEPLWAGGRSCSGHYVVVPALEDCNPDLRRGVATVCRWGREVVV